MDLITSIAHNFIENKCVYAKYGMHGKLVNKGWVYANKECTLNTAIMEIKVTSRIDALAIRNK